ncbi:hypothetical protein F383_27618 [Gossypium arboreum]|uniref:Uncharacterized protein n=1 Tax=Gossypium arboreum TaxID=29729 RepID=A0A0B0P725_GOSAR|nr:hypothetical protein F383_27618 [Gossypium arboreum]
MQENQKTQLKKIKTRKQREPRPETLYSSPRNYQKRFLASVKHRGSQFSPSIPGVISMQPNPFVSR